MNSRGLLAMMVGASLCVACSRNRYADAHGIFADDIATIAVYAPLLDGTIIPPGSAHDAVARVASNEAADQICLRTRLTFPKPSTDIADPSSRIATIFASMEKTCCDHIDKKDLTPDATTQLATQCKAAVDHASTDLASIDAEAVKIGLPARTIPSIDSAAAKTGTELDRNSFAAILFEATPTNDETRLADLWKDPNARASVISAACESAANTERFRVPPGPNGQPFAVAADVQHARADVTAKQCAIVKSYQGLARELSDAAIAKKKTGATPPDTTNFCQRWKDLYDPASAPAAVTSLLPDVQTRCK